MWLLAPLFRSDFVRLCAIVLRWVCSYMVHASKFVVRWPFRRCLCIISLQYVDCWFCLCPSIFSLFFFPSSSFLFLLPRFSLAHSFCQCVLFFFLGQFLLLLSLSQHSHYHRFHMLHKSHCSQRYRMNDRVYSSNSSIVCRMFVNCGSWNLVVAIRNGVIFCLADKDKQSKIADFTPRTSSQTQTRRNCHSYLTSSSNSSFRCQWHEMCANCDLIAR